MRFLVGFVSLVINIVSALHPPSEELANEARIYRGHNAEPGQFPYTVGLEILSFRRFDWCGGALIGSNWVLTCAHCFDNSPLLFNIYLGMTFMQDAKVTYVLNEDNVFVHPNWKDGIGFDDIALVEIPTTALCNNISPIPLPKISSTDPISVGSSGIVAGWGFMGDTVDLAERLQWTHASIITNHDCRHVYTILSSKEVCTTNSELGSACVGDSGNPLVMESTGELIGIVDSTHDVSCEHGDPVVYTRVWPYLEWIKEQTEIWY